jgi:Ca2+-binding EF-hand superfamily protein
MITNHITTRIVTGRNALALAAGLALLAAPAAFAGKDADRHFKMMDADGDGRISRAEHAAGARKMFDQSDANRDGVVTAAEMDAAALARGEKTSRDDKSSAEKIKVIDQDGDGRLSLAEHEAGTERMFAAMDKDADGFLSREENEAGLKMMKTDR